MMHLEAGGWVWSRWIAKSKRRRGDVLPDAYEVGETTVWFSNSTVSRNYVLALALAEDCNNKQRRNQQKLTQAEKQKDLETNGILGIPHGLGEAVYVELLDGKTASHTCLFCMAGCPKDRALIGG